MKNLNLRAQILIIITILLGVLVSIHYLSNLKSQDIIWLLILAGLTAVTQVFKVEGATEKSSYNLSWVLYGFTFLLLGAPATLFIILISHIVEWIFHKYPWYIQTYNIATYALAVTIAELVYKAFNPAQAQFTIAFAIGLLAALLSFTLTNHFLVGLVIWFARGQNFKESGVFGFLTLMIDFTLMSLGLAAAIIWGINPFAVLFIFAPIFLVQNGIRMPALQRQTEIDPKTNLYNAKFFAISFEKELERAIQFNRPITLVLGDLDLLRNINNTYGHVAGDVVLTGIAKILRESFRDFDLVARFGGEEFAIMMPGTVPDEAFEIVEAAREKIAATDFVVDTSVQPIKATMSFGICGIQGNRGASLSTMDITNDADAALYNAKLSGRNQTRLYSSNKIDELFNINQIHKPLDESTQEKTPIEARFEAASKPIESEKTQDLPDKKPTKQAGQFTGPIKTKEPWQVKTYVGFVIAIAVGFAILSFSQFKGQLNISGILIFTLLIILSEIFSIEIYSKDSSVSTAAAFLIAGALMFGPMGALIFSFTIALTAMIKSRAPILRLFFNTGNHFISSSLCIILVSGLYSNFIETPIYMQLIFSMFCGIIVFLSSTFLLTGVLHFSEKRPFFNLWYENFNWLIPYYLAFGVISFALVVGYTFAGLLGLLAIMTPLLILRLSQFQYIDKTKTIVKQLRDANEELKENNLIISEINEDILLSLANTIDLRDSYTLGHSTGVAQIAVLIAKEIGLSSKTTDTIHKSSLLHDIGKIGIPDKILFKPDQLTFEEFEFIKEHPARGARIVEVNASLSELGPIIRHHHERFDGGGYPDGLQGMDIPLEARIICLADSVQAMSSNRPYRKRLEREKVIEEVKINSGTQFDPQITKIFLELLESNRITLGNSEWDEFNTTPNEYLAKYLSKRNA